MEWLQLAFLKACAICPAARVMPRRAQSRHFFLRITEWFVLEGTLKIVWFQPPCHEQGHLPPDQVAQSSIQPGLEHCQRGGSHSFSGQPVSGPHHPHGEKSLPDI